MWQEGSSNAVIGEGLGYNFICICKYFIEQCEGFVHEEIGRGVFKRRGGDIRVSAFGGHPASPSTPCFLELRKV
uniref:Uncharacterized protein n=1 Tax=viral metagenome TaxID=1070528 RepID=A0A6C0K1M0_9ZZZZ